MRHGGGRAIFLVLALLLPIASNSLRAEPDRAPPPPADSSRYIGSEKCGSCHQIQYKGWVKTFHSTVVKDARKNPSAILGDMGKAGLPFSKDDVCMTIGGHWDQRYLKKIGDDYYVLPMLWSVQSKKWRPYSTYGWDRRPYSKYCVGCHSVGFDPETKKVVEHSVGCESCHAPGARHAAGPSRDNIVNPKRLPADRAEEICASCHVRGKDASGDYFFPVAYTPGDDLSRHLLPLERNEGESVRDAIHRIWAKWRVDREAQARSRCEVCGIHQNVKPQGEKVSIDAICMSCHEYEDRLPQHTRHKAGTAIGCTDCHKEKDPESNEEQEGNVHSYSYYLIHPQNCWDGEIYKRCAKCHTDRTEQWGYDTFISWKKPVVVDH